jgi:hypothetical protein
MRWVKHFHWLLLPIVLISLVGCWAKPTPPANFPQPTPTIFSGLQASPALEQKIITPISDPGEISTSPAVTQPLAGGTTVEVDINREVHPISSLIYGLSGGETEYLQELRPTLISWGGNPSTRYNWQLGNAWNAGRDWYYTNVNYGVKDGVSAADDFLQIAKSLGIATRLAVPTLGWVAKDDKLCSFPLADGTCGDAAGADCRQPGQIADPQTANTPSTPESIAAWMSHLQQQGLTPSFLAMDNEPELWGITHYDVHPSCTTYEEVLDKYLAYAAAVRSVDPQTELAGPVACCWYSYWNTAPGPAGQSSGMPADYLAWFLSSVRQHDETTGERSLDILDVHFYPQGGVYNQKTDPTTNALRLRSTRALWDRSYKDESWIDQPIYFIPRMKELIDQYYPGTRLGISEWNFGADEDINGALAIADTLGIFGREGVHYAAYWRFPPAGSPGFFSFKMYTNYDNKGSRFGGSSVLAESSDPENISSYAAFDAESGGLQLMLINKDADRPVDVQVQVRGALPGSDAAVYRYDPSYLSDITLTTIRVVTNEFPISLPPSSITLIVIKTE